MPRFQSKNFVLLSGFALLTAFPFAARAQDAKPVPTPSAPTAAADDSTPVSWTLKYKKGETRSYRANATITGNTSMGPIVVVVKSVQKREITQIAPGGSVMYTSTPVSNSVTFNDQELPNTDNKSVTLMTIDPSGVITDIKADDTPGGDTLQQLGVVVSSTPVPPKPVKVGDTWTVEYAGKLFKSRKFNLTYTYAGREVVFGKNTYKLKVSGDLPINTGEKDLAKITGTLNLDPDAGDSIRAAFKITNLDLTQGGATQKVDVDSKADVILPGINDKEEKK